MQILQSFFSDPLFNFIFVVLIFAIIFNIWELEKRKKLWQSIMESHQFTQSVNDKGKVNKNSIQGLYNHYQITLSETSMPIRRNGKNKTNFFTSASTVIKVEIKNPENCQMVLSRNIPRYGNRPASIPTGDEEIDEIFIVSGEPQDFALKIINHPKVRPLLMNLSQGSQIVVEGNEIIYDQTGRITNAEKVNFIFDFLCQMANVIKS